MYNIYSSFLNSVKVNFSQSCLTLWDPTDYTVHGILQASILEWVGFSFSRGSSQPRNRTGISCIAGRFFTSWATREANIILKVKLKVIQSCLWDSLRPHRLYSPWNSPGQNTGVGTFPLSRGSSPPRDRTQVSHIAGRFFYLLSYKGSPRILEWVAYPFSRGSSQPKSQTRVSCIAGRFFTNWAIREAQIGKYLHNSNIFQCMRMEKLCI